MSIKKNEMAKVNENTAVMNADEWALLGGDAGKGFEHQTKADQTIPFLGVIQSNSPIIETKAEARPGMLFNTVTQDVYDGATGLGFVPVDTREYFVEWKPRTLGGGFVKMHERSSDLVTSIISSQEFGKYKMIKGDLNSNDLVQTFYVYGILISPEGFTTPIVVAFTSTKIRAYQNWMNKANGVQIKSPNGRILSGKKDLPLWNFRYRIKTIQQKNPKGTFYNYTVSFDAPTALESLLSPKGALYLQAKEFYEFVSAGTIKTAVETQQQAGEAEEEEIPFK